MRKENRQIALITNKKLHGVAYLPCVVFCVLYWNFNPKTSCKIRIVDMCADHQRIFTGVCFTVEMNFYIEHLI